MTGKDNDILMFIMRYCERVKADIEKYGSAYEDFNFNPTFKDSVSFNILQIGELVNKLSKEFKESTAEEAHWDQMYGMRNRIVHGYQDVDFEIVWDSAVYDVPKLLEFCKKTIKFDE